MTAMARSRPAEPPLRRRVRLAWGGVLGWRPTWPRIRGILRSLLTSYLALAITLWVQPGTRGAYGAFALVPVVFSVIVVGSVLRFLLTRLTLVIGTVGLFLAGFVIQGLTLTVALRITPGVHSASFMEALSISWIAVVVSSVVNWLFDTSTEDTFFDALLRRAVRIAALRERTDVPGMLVVQLDGLAAPVLRQALTAGAMPTVARWLRSRDHVLRDWHTGVPATTPAGQAVLLHGNTTAVPAFRWYEKDTGTVRVANRPGDAAVIQRRLSEADGGDGLLAHDGVSVSNLFSGDAPTVALTMSDARLPGPREGVAAFALQRSGMTRGIIVYLSNVLRELFEGRRQRLRDVRPRVRRSGAFLWVRGLTTVLLRDLTVSIVVEQLAIGAPNVYVDLVDYDEVAHHVGPTRPEAMRVLEELDRVLRLFERVAAEAARPYEIVLVSDHGQAQGEPFGQGDGSSLHRVVHDLIAEPRPEPDTRGRAHAKDRGAGVHDARPAEQWGAANLLATSAVRGDGVMPRAIGRAVRSHSDASGGEPTVAMGPGAPRHDRRVADEEVLVLSSGSLSHLYVTDIDGRVGRDLIERRYPGLIGGLAAHPQIGAVLVRDSDGPLVIGADGWRRLCEHGPRQGEGEDPLEQYGLPATDSTGFVDVLANDLIELDGKEHVGDLVVFGACEPDLGEVHAFEELVGSHGGIGGDQASAFLVHPVDWCTGVAPVSVLRQETPMSGREVYAAMTDRQRQLGLRPPVVVDVPELTATEDPQPEIAARAPVRVGDEQVATAGSPRPAEPVRVDEA